MYIHWDLVKRPETKQVNKEKALIRAMMNLLDTFLDLGPLALKNLEAVE